MFSPSRSKIDGYILNIRRRMEAETKLSYTNVGVASKGSKEEQKKLNKK